MSMELDDPLNLLPVDRLQPTLATVGLPLPHRIALDDRPGGVARYRLSFPENELLLTVLVHAGAHNPLLSAATALFLLQMEERLPVARVGRLLGAHLLGRAASIGPIVSGISGEARLRKHPEDAEAVGADLGRIAAILADNRQPSFGISGDGRRFLPTRRSWSATCRAKLEAAHLQARANGVDLGGLSQLLYDRAVQRLPATEARPACLVHGQLMPRHLTYHQVDQGWQLVQIHGWGRACAADPVLDWVRPLLARPALLKGFVRAHGAPETVMEPQALAALELGLYTEALERVAHAVGAEALMGPTRASKVLGRARALAQFSAELDVEARLRAAFGQRVQAPRPPVALGWSDLALRPLRRVPSVPVDQVAVLAASLAGATLAELWAGKQAGKRCEAALRLCGAALRNSTGPGPGEPIADRTLWRTRIVQRASESTHDRHWSLILTWLVLDHVHRLRGATSDAVLRGLECLVYSRVAAEQSTTDRLGAPARMFHGILGLAAAIALDLGSDTQEAMAAQVADAWDGLVFAPHTAEEGRELSSLLPEQLEGRALGALPLLRAMAIPGVLSALPGTAARLLELARPE
jgi:hypothetical protein